DRKDKVILINGSDFYEPLKKSKGKKRKEMAPHNRKSILDALTNFEDTDYAKVFDKWHFYFNKQAIMLTNVDYNGKSLESILPVKKNAIGEEIRAKSIKVEANSITVLDTFKTDGLKVINTMELTSFPEPDYTSLKDYYDTYYKSFVAEFDYKDPAFMVLDTKGNSYSYNEDKETIVKTDKNQNETELGNGKIVIKAS